VFVPQLQFLSMTKYLLGLAAALAPVAQDPAGDQSLSEHRKLNLLLAAVCAALAGLALIMPGDW
jgi:hypothetical protein